LKITFSSFGMMYFDFYVCVYICHIMYCMCSTIEYVLNKVIHHLPSIEVLCSLVNTKHTKYINNELIRFIYYFDLGKSHFHLTRLLIIYSYIVKRLFLIKKKKSVLSRFTGYSLNIIKNLTNWKYGSYVYLTILKQNLNKLINTV